MTSSRLDAIDLDAVRDGLEDAVRVANEAIRAVLAQTSMKVASKGEAGPVTEADYAADRVLHERLMPLIEGARWLSEESEEEAPLIRGEATWVIDPLDGTREFLRGLPEYG
ncbi:MAG: inositol monophosphatase family protein, partial [Chloroflexota bacterium]